MENAEEITKKNLLDSLAPLLGKVNPAQLMRWVSAEECPPSQKSYYIVLRGDSNPNFVHTCKPGVHFWDGEEWSSQTSYWLENLNENL